MHILTATDSGVLRLFFHNAGVTVEEVKGVDEFEAEFCVASDSDWVVLDIEEIVYILYDKNKVSFNRACELLIEACKKASSLALDSDEIEEMMEPINIERRG